MDDIGSDSIFKLVEREVHPIVVANLVVIDRKFHLAINIHCNHLSGFRFSSLKSFKGEARNFTKVAAHNFGGVAAVDRND